MRQYIKIDYTVYNEIPIVVQTKITFTDSTYTNFFTKEIEIEGSNIESQLNDYSFVLDENEINMLAKSYFTIREFTIKSPNDANLSTPLAFKYALVNPDLSSFLKLYDFKLKYLAISFRKMTQPKQAFPAQGNRPDYYEPSHEDFLLHNNTSPVKDSEMGK